MLTMCCLLRRRARVGSSSILSIFFSKVKLLKKLRARIDAGFPLSKVDQDRILHAVIVATGKPRNCGDGNPSCTQLLKTETGRFEILFWSRCGQLTVVLFRFPRHVGFAKIMPFFLNPKLPNVPTRACCENQNRFGFRSTLWLARLVVWD